MRYLIGIDDTDNLESRGTGHRARMLGLQLDENGICRLHSITRHQLFVSPLIPYTSHNSSACLMVSDVGNKQQLIDYCRRFLLSESAEGSDAGLCIAAYDLIHDDIVNWGNQAKTVVLKMEDAIEIAQKNDVYLEGLTGTRCGIIGALAAVGLRKEGNDGRLLWMRHLRETQGIFTIDQILALIKIESVVDMEGFPVPPNAIVTLSDWSRPVMMNNKITLILQKYSSNEETYYTCASKEYIKHISG